jgi:hypothetical protein
MAAGCAGCDAGAGASFRRAAWRGAERAGWFGWTAVFGAPAVLGVPSALGAAAEFGVAAGFCACCCGLFLLQPPSARAPASKMERDTTGETRFMTDLVREVRGILREPRPGVKRTLGSGRNPGVAE